MTTDPSPQVTPTVAACQGGYPAAMLPADQACPEPDQAWFWTPDWQAGEQEATDQANRGEGERYYSDAEFLESLVR